MLACVEQLLSLAKQLDGGVVATLSLLPALPLGLGLAALRLGLGLTIGLPLLRLAARAARPLRLGRLREEQRRRDRDQ